MEEYESSPRAIEGVGTSTAGFVGLAVRGPAIGAPSLVVSFADFQRQFGGYLSEYAFGGYRYLAYAVEQFFINGGTRCFVSRVVPENAAIAAAQQGVLSFRAANEGKWGNRIQISFITANQRKMQLVKREGERIYTAKSTEGFREGDLVEFAGEANRIESIFENTVTFEQEFAGDPVDASLIPKSLVYSLSMDLMVRYENEAETYAGVNLNPASPNYVIKRMAASKLVTVTAGADDRIENPVSVLFGEGALSGSISLSGGSDGTMDAVNAGVFIGQDNGPGQRTGLQAFLENNMVSIMAIPGITIPEVVVALVAHCENLKSRFAVIDMPVELVKTNELIEYRSLIDSTYAAMYHPWVQVYDNQSKKPAYIPPSGSVAGVFSRTDISRGVHKAPANESVSCTGLSTVYTAAEQDILNPAGINLIRSLPGQGIRIWGARTASSNTSFKYVNIRRLFIFVEESIKAATNWVVFEPNNSSLWARVQMSVSSFLGGLFRAGMLAGESPAEAFFVNIGTSTMGWDDIMNGRLICEIGIAPSRPAEFVIFRVTQFTAVQGGE